MYLYRFDHSFLAVFDRSRLGKNGHGNVHKLKIKCMYSIAAMLTRENKEPWHIDHIIPLQGKMVSGLHVPSNLQVMLGSENIGKKNKFEVNHA